MKASKWLILLVLVIAVSWGMYECKYYYSQWLDYRNSPWAYSRNENAKLLVGKWTGAFKDPDQIQKTIKLEINKPLTEAERATKAGKTWKCASYSSRNKNKFHGVATVISKLGTEKYVIHGAVNKDDCHKLQFSFQSENEKNRVLPNFALLGAKNGIWQDDELTITFNFSFLRADGSSHWSSEDPRFEKKVTTTLTRQLP